MLNKNRIFEKLNNLNLDKEQFIILSGASLVIFGVKEFTNDIDIAVSKEYYEELLKNRNCTLNLVIDDVGIYYLDDGIVEFSYRNFDSEYVLIDEFKVQSLESVIEMKNGFGREKDFKDIEIIKEFQKDINNLV